MRDALVAQNRPILYSLCEWGEANVQTWGNKTAQSWRSTGDISPSWSRIMEILNENSFYMNYVDFYGHSDPDMLEVGNGINNQECRSHFALWAAMKSPLLIGTDLAKLDSDKLAILKNKYLLAFNQDNVHGAPASPYKWGTNPDWTFDKTRPAEYWSGIFKQGTLVAALNTNDSPQNKTISWKEVPGLDGNKAYSVTDVWSDKDLGCIKDGINAVVDTHDTVVYVVKSECSNGLKDGFIGKEFSA